MIYRNNSNLTIITLKRQWVDSKGQVQKNIPWCSGNPVMPSNIQIRKDPGWILTSHHTTAKVSFTIMMKI